MRAHFNAVLARLRESEVIVFDTAVIGTAPPTYALLLGGAPDAANREAVAKTADPDAELEFTYIVRCVSLTADGAREVGEKAFNALTGWQPVVAGRKCQKLQLDYSEPVRLNDQVKPPLFELDLEFLLISRRG